MIAVRFSESRFYKQMLYGKGLCFAKELSASFEPSSPLQSAVNTVTPVIKIAPSQNLPNTHGNVTRLPKFPDLVNAQFSTFYNLSAI